MDLGLERAGMECRWQVEIDDFATRVLEKHWPDVKRHRDVKTFPPDDGGWGVDLICGGFPCQPVSVAGKRKGKEDERWLWPEFARILRVLRPRYVLVENVPGLFLQGFGDVLGDLATLGYDAEWEVVSAASVGAPHLRERLFIVAYSNEKGLERRNSKVMRKCTGERVAWKGGSSDLSNSVGERVRLQGRGEAEAAAEGVQGKGGKRQRVRPDAGAVHGPVPDTNVVGRGAAGEERGRKRIAAEQGEEATRERQKKFKAYRRESKGRWWPTPVSNFRRGHDEFSSWLDGNDHLIATGLAVSSFLESMELFDANEKKNRLEQGLQELWDFFGKEGKRGTDWVSSQETLLTYLCKYREYERSSEKGRNPVEGEKIERKEMRSLRGNGKFGSTSRRRGRVEQRSCEHSDFVQELSRILARDSQKAWIAYIRENAKLMEDLGIGGLYGISPTVEGPLPDRANRLKCLGNAVLPAVAEWFGRLILEMDGRRR